MNAGFNGLYRVNKRGVCNTTFGNPKPSKDLVRAGEMRALGKLLRRRHPSVSTSRSCAKGEARRHRLLRPALRDRQGPLRLRELQRQGFRRFDLQRLGATLRDLDRRGVRWSLTDGNSQVAGRRTVCGTCAEVQRRSGSCKAKGRGWCANCL